jgi:hypothetical protein
LIRGREKLNSYDTLFTKNLTYTILRLNLGLSGEKPASEHVLRQEYSRLSIIRAWFNRFAAQPRQCIFKEKNLFSVSITFV